MHPQVRIAYIGHRLLDPSWSFTNRSSPFWRLYHNQQPGAAIESAAGRLALDPGVVVLVPAGTVFSALAPARPVSHLYLHFAVEDPGSRLPDRPLPVAIDEVLLALLGEHDRWVPGDPLRACALIYHALALAQRPGDDAGAVEDDLSLRHIRENLHRQLRVSQLARMTGVGPDHFIRLFARRYGTTPARFIAGERLALARHLLATTDLTIDAVAERCGYASRGHLATVFQRSCGTTPGVFRQKHGIGAGRT